MRAHSIKTAALTAKDHGTGIIVVIGGVEWKLAQLTVVDQPKDLSMCDGRTVDGDLVLFDAESVDMVRIQAGPEGKLPALPKYPRRE